MIKLFGIVIMWQSTYKSQLWMARGEGYRAAVNNIKELHRVLDEELIGKRKSLTQ